MVRLRSGHPAILSFLLIKLAIAQTPTTTSLSVSPNPATLGSSVTLVATVSPNTASGKVTFLDGGGAVGVASVSNGTASLTTSLLAAGTRQLRAEYQANGTDQASISSVFTETVTPLFAGSLTLAVHPASGVNPAGIATGDFNGDGRTDLAVANEFGPNICIFLGAGGGSFQAPFLYTGVSQPDAIVVGDFNGDGKQDLAVANASANTVTIFLGNGDGTFQSSSAAVGYVPYGIAAGDFNGDGLIDLVTSNEGSGSVSVLLGNGDGTFQTATTVTLGGNTPQSIVVGDFNGDGISDVAVCLFDQNTVEVLLGKSGSGLQAPLPYGVGTNPKGLAVADLNGDGKADLVVGNSGGANVSVLLGDGDGTFQASSTYTAVASPVALVAGDFNGDGKADVAVIGFDGGVAVLPGGGTGGLGAPVLFSAGTNPTAAAVADFNADGKTDLAVANFNSGDVSVLTGGPAVVTAVQGSGQTALTGSAFPTALKASVTGFGIPVSAASVSFSAPAGGASGAFSGSGAGATVVTGSDGTATAPVFSANVTPGSYTVTATADGGSASFQLTNTTSGCTFSISPTSLAYDDQGGGSALTVTASGPDCAWAAASDSSWATLSSASGVGNGSTVVTVAANTSGVSRVANINVGGQEVQVEEWGTQQVFTDVPPTAYYFDAVNLLYANQVTIGCAPQLYCPTDDVTRAQMAVFLVRSILHTNIFPYSQTPYFSDVGPTDFGFAYIQKLYELGVTSGCEADLYCPNNSVTRDQMAVFIMRARYGPTATFSYPSTPYFTDVPASYWAFADIQRMRQDNITSGCSATTYCPAGLVTRGDMALFLMRGEFNQLLPAETPLVTAVNPAVLTHGSSATFTVTGTNTNFAQGASTLGALPDGITAATITVTSPTSLSVQLSASSTAALQPFPILVITGTEQAVLPNAISVQ